MSLVASAPVVAPLSFPRVSGDEPIINLSKQFSV